MKSNVTGEDLRNVTRVDEQIIPMTLPKLKVPKQEELPQAPISLRVTIYGESDIYMDRYIKLLRDLKKIKGNYQIRVWFNYSYAGVRVRDGVPKQNEQ